MSGETGYSSGSSPDGKLQIHYVRLDNIKLLPDNAKDHDLGAIVESIEEFGFLDPVSINERTGHDFNGNGRAEALAVMKASGRYGPGHEKPLPRGIMLDKDGMWLVPTVQGINLDPETEQRAALALNRTNELGGYKTDVLAAVLQRLAADNVKNLRGTGYSSDDLDDLLRMMSPPSLDDLESKYGEPTEEDFWPVIRVKVHPTALELYKQVMGELEGETEALRFYKLLQLANIAVQEGLTPET